MIGKLIKNSLFLFLSTIILFACSNDKQENEKKLTLKIDQELWEISSDAAMINTSIHILKDATCLASDHLTELNSKNTNNEKKLSDKADKVLKNMNKRFSDKCEYFSEIIKETSPVFYEIKKQKKLLNELYTFSIYRETEQGDLTYRKEYIGLFSSFESCEKFELLAREYDFPTKRCKRWVE